MTPVIKKYGPEAVLISFGDVIHKDINDHVIQAVYLLKGLIPESCLIRAGYSDIMIKYGHEIDFQSVVSFIESCLQGQQAIQHQGMVHEIPVDFDCLINDWDKITSLSVLNKESLILKLCSITYNVMMTGFLPGFPYLGVLPEELHYPRLKEPRLRVPKGSLAIGGEQLGIYPRESPGGWNIIGQIDLEFFSIKTGSLFQLGDQLTFRPKVV